MKNDEVPKGEVKHSVSRIDGVERPYAACAVGSADEPRPMIVEVNPSSLEVAPFELMHIVSKIGQGCRDDLGDVRLNRILAAVRANPILPLTLRCRVTSSCYTYQNPGPDPDARGGGELFRRRRDLAIVHRLGLAPGDTRPAIELFQRLIEKVESARGILRFDTVAPPAWCGEDAAARGYDKGRALGLNAIILPRPSAEKALVKRESAAAVLAAGMLRIRPHHLMCMTCFYGGRLQKIFEPIAEDNLYEAIVACQRHPRLPIEFVDGPCMICPPCSNYRPADNKCIGGNGMSLRDELKDLDVLQRLGLSYGDVAPASDLFARLFATVASTREICGHGDGVVRGYEWTICGGPEGNAGYVAGRAAGLGIPGVPGARDPASGEVVTGGERR